MSKSYRYIDKNSLYSLIQEFKTANINRIGHLIPAEVKIDGEELVATLRGSFAFVF